MNEKLVFVILTYCVFGYCPTVEHEMPLSLRPWKEQSRKAYLPSEHHPADFCLGNYLQVARN